MKDINHSIKIFSVEYLKSQYLSNFPPVKFLCYTVDVMHITIRIYEDLENGILYSHTVQLSYKVKLVC